MSRRAWYVLPGSDEGGPIARDRRDSEAGDARKAGSRGDRPPEAGSRGGDLWIRALRFSTVGLEFGVGAVLGYLAGHWLDGKLGTDPYLALAGLLLGIGAAFASLVRLVREMSREGNETDDDQTDQEHRGHDQG